MYIDAYRYIYLYISQLSSKANEKNAKLSAFFFLASNFPFSNASFFLRYGTATEYTKHSLINSPSENGLIFFATLWAITKLVFAAASLDL